MCILILLWLAASASMIFNSYPLIGMAIFIVLYRYAYVSTRYDNLFRGAGAVGLMCWYAVIYLFTLRLVLNLDPSHATFETVLFAIRVDVAIIMICAGLYKGYAGRKTGEGVEYALANPFWSRMHAQFQKINPKHPFAKLQYAIGWLTEILAGVLLLLPGLEMFGALLVIGIFLYVYCTLKLAQLPLLMVVLSFLWLPDVSRVFSLPEFQGLSFTAPEWTASTIKILAVSYVALLILTKFNQYAELYFQLKLPKFFTASFDKFAQVVPIIVWRVFTPDIIDFFVRVQASHKKTQEIRDISNENTVYRFGGGGGFLLRQRFRHVAESVVLSSLMGTRKYFGEESELFRVRAVRYAQSLPLDDEEIAVLEFVSIRSGDRQFEYLPTIRFYINPLEETVREEILVADWTPELRAPVPSINLKIGAQSNRS